MRIFYSFLWWSLILPIALLRLWWRGRKEPEYRKNIRERLAVYSLAIIHPGCIWLHAVSVGETRAAEPLVNELLKNYPEKTILLTCMTPTGRATGLSLFGKNERIRQTYLPYDTGLMMKRFIRHFQPSLCILMETEVWPNLLHQCARHHIPVALVNARLSQRSLKKGKRFPSLIQEAANNITCVAAQTESDAARLREFGTQKVVVAGSVKFDVTPSSEALQKGERLRNAIGQRPVFICASTRDGEEKIILDSFHALVPANALLIIVPRHPQRFEEIAESVKSRGIPMMERTALSDGIYAEESVPENIRILLGNSMGEMFAYYAASDVAFIGGSLNPLGGQNLIEACAVGKPVIVGPYTFNFDTITEDAISHGAAIRIANADELMREASRLLQDQNAREEMAGKGLLFASLQRGATEKTIALLKPLLDRN